MNLLEIIAFYMALFCGFLFVLLMLMVIGFDLYNPVTNFLTEAMILSMIISIASKLASET